jgi:hypothetical protein
LIKSDTKMLYISWIRKCSHIRWQPQEEKGVIPRPEKTKNTASRPHIARVPLVRYLWFIA